MLLVLIALGLTAVLVLSFLASQGPTAVVASNIERKSRARAIAESALVMAIDYVNEDATWRTDKTSGVWMSDAALDGGTFTLMGIDEDDGDLSDDFSDPVTLTVVATFDGVTHRVSAIVTPGSTASNKLVLVVDDASSLTAKDTARQALAEGWGYSVVYLTDSDPQIDFDVQAVDAAVFWVSEDVASGSLGTKLRDTAVGVMFEERANTDDFGLSSTQSTNNTYSTDMNVLDNTHEITDGLSLGSITLASSSTYFGGSTVSMAAGVQILMDDGGGEAFVMAVEAGDTLTFGPAPARRSTFLADNSFDVTALNAAGLELLRATVDWAAEGATPPPNTPTLLALYEFDQVTITPTLAGRWKLDEVAAGTAGVTQIGDALNLSSGTYIDAYDSSDGAYGGANQQLDVLFTTNADGTSPSINSDTVNIDGGTLYGSIQVGEGADPADVITLTSGGTITGTQSPQITNSSIPTTYYSSEPSGFPANAGSVILNSGGTVTWNTDLHYNDLTISNGTQVHVSGDVEVLVSDDLDLQDGDIVLDPGATLTIWVDEDIIISNGSTINNDTTRAADVMIIQYVETSGDDYDLTMNDGIIVGRIICADDVHMNNGSAIYGSLLVEDDIHLSSGAIHIDLAVAPPAPYSNGSPTIAADSSALANHGTVNNGPTGGVTGQHGTAYEFDGSNDYVEIPHDDSYLMQAGTFSIWLKADTTSPSRQGLFCKDATNYATGGHFSVFLRGSYVEVRMQSTSASYYVRSSSGSIVAGQWYHMMYAWGEEGMALYLDGVLVDTDAYTGGLGTTSGGIGNYEPIVLGSNAWASGNLSATPLQDYFDGTLDDLRIYNERMSEAQALEIYGGANEPTPFLSEAIVQDTSGFGDPLDLAVQDTSAVTWSAAGITFDSDTLAMSVSEAEKLSDSIMATGEFSIEVLLTRATPASTSSPSRIVALSEGAGDSNFVLGQDSSDYEARVRDSATGSSGVLSPEFVSTTGLNASGDTHVVLSYKDGEVSVYIDGVLDETNTAGGTLNNWESDHYLLLGGAFGGGSHWRGTISRVAIYDRGFNANQAENVFNGDPPGNGASGSGTVVWDELD